MTKAPKPDLDEATIEIARRMLNTPPKQHEEMKVGKHKTKRTKSLLKATPKRRAAK